MIQIDLKNKNNQVVIGKIDHEKKETVFSANGDGSYKYAIGEQNGDLRQFTKEMNAALNGRGGGKPFFVQGSVKASEDEIRQFFRQ